MGLGTFLDLLLVVIVLGALLEGFQRGAVRSAMRLVGLGVALVLGAVALRIAVVLGLAQTPVAVGLVYGITVMILSGIVEVFASLYYNRMIAAQADDDADDVYDDLGHGQVTPAIQIGPKSPFDRAAGMVIAAVATTITNGVFIIVLSLLGLELFDEAVAQSNLAPVFVGFAQQVGLLLPPELIGILG